MVLGGCSFCGDCVCSPSIVSPPFHNQTHSVPLSRCPALTPGPLPHLAAGTCWQNCDSYGSNYADAGAVCVMTSLPACNAGYKAIGPTCFKNCNSGGTDLGEWFRPLLDAHRQLAAVGCRRRPLLCGLY